MLFSRKSRTSSKVQPTAQPLSLDEWTSGQPISTAHPKKRTKILLAGLALFLFWFIPFVPKLSFGNISVTRWTKAAGKVSAKVGPNRDDWARFSNISRHLINALIVAEDDNFYEHFGLDWHQIHRSIETNIKKKAYRRGASTITQQVVKMAFLTRDKTLTRKAREAVGALLLETCYSKTRILEWYVNLVEFGDNVYGINAAARHYFQTKPEQLTIAQSIHLALVVPSPNKWSKGLRQRVLTPFGHARFLHLATALKRRGHITADQWKYALATGDFGRPIHGTENLLSVDEEKINDMGDEDLIDIDEEGPDDQDSPPSAAKDSPSPIATSAGALPVPSPTIDGGAR